LGTVNKILEDTALKIKISSVRVIILLLTALAASQSGLAQNKDKGGTPTVWSPPDKSFTIEVPIDLEEMHDYQSKAYGGVIAGYTFQVVILDATESIRKLPLKEKLRGLQFFVGGDDDREFVETYSTIGGLPAKEILYQKQNNRGLMIDGCDRIYILALHTKDRKDLDSDIAKQFLTSFRTLESKK
jgi:hypothetical protein